MVDNVLFAAEAIARGQCVLCAGSRLDGGPALRGLIAALYGSLTEVDPVEAERMPAEQPLTAADYVRRRMRGRFEVVLRAAAEALDGPPATPPALASLPFRAVLTTAYGEAIARAFAPRQVVRLLGSMARGDVAFSAPEVADRLGDGAYEPVRDLFRWNTFLFLGFERRDPELELVLEHILGGLRGHRPHLALIPGLGAAACDDLLTRFNLHVVDGELDPFVDAVAHETSDSPYAELTVAESAEPAEPAEPESAEAVAVADVAAEVAEAESAEPQVIEMEALDPLETLLDAAAAESGPARRAEVLTEVARVFEEERADPDRALTTLIAGFRLAPSARVARRLERLAETTGRWEEVAEELSAGAVRSDDARLAGQLYRQLGRLEEERLGRPAAAVDSYRRALTIDPCGEEAWDALDALARRRADGRAILDAIDAAGLPLDAAIGRYRALHADAPNDLIIATVLAELCRRNRDVEGAVRAYQAILAGDPERLGAAPERLDAARALADLLDAAGRDAELVPVLDILTRSELDRRARYAGLRRLARAAGAVGDGERALDALARAAALEPDDAEVQREHGVALFLAGRFAEALAALERAHERRAPGPRTADVELRSLLGRAALRVGRRDLALLHLEAAFRLDGEHPPTVAALLELGDLSADREIACRRALVRQLPDQDRFDHIVRIGERFLEDFDDATRALAAWTAALELRPNDHRLLHRCLDVLVQERRWDAALDILDRLIAIEELPARRASYRSTAGLIARDELASPEAALRYLNAAVDDDPTHDRAVPALERLLEAQERWRDLERHYARLIERLGPEAPDGRNAERMRLWSALARLCLARPELGSNAAVAFAVAEQVKERSEERLDAGEPTVSAANYK